MRNMLAIELSFILETVWRLQQPLTDVPCLVIDNAANPTARGPHHLDDCSFLWLPLTPNATLNEHAVAEFQVAEAVPSSLYEVASVNLAIFQDLLSKSMKHAIEELSCIFFAVDFLALAVSEHDVSPDEMT